ncbi:hypothetical protein K8R32_03450 [bacterium]|nr:hypothetical protein [bacterium]
MIFKIIKQIVINFSKKKARYVMMNWKNDQLFGFSAKSVDDIDRILSLGVNMIEIKLERLEKSGFPLYRYNNPSFTPNWQNIAKLKEIIKGVAVQFHLPVENIITLEKEKGFNISIPEHHNIVIDRFMMFERVYRAFGLGSVLTLHPPLISANGKILIGKKKAIKNAKLFFDKLDRIRREQGHKTIIGMENMTDIKTGAGNLGFLPRHFKDILIDTRTIGLTVDVGHRRLAKDFRIRDFLALGIQIVNFHFHGNEGVFNPDNWDDDQHLLPDDDNVKGYKNYLRYFRRHRIPVVLEISHLERYTDQELLGFVGRFKREFE